MRAFSGATFGLKSGVPLGRAVLVAAIFACAATRAPDARPKAADGSCLSALSGSSRIDQGSGAPPLELKDVAGGVPLHFVYKQADRKSSAPMNVASARLDDAEAGKDGDG